ncbi:MAG: zinc ABC transporter substrate-binding protein [Bacteroidales bacterium]|nr:zinc ABC transporter substrate-binding protein [Bacteroidales bacterium]
MNLIIRIVNLIPNSFVLTAFILLLSIINNDLICQERNQNRLRSGQSGNTLDIVCSFSDFAAITEFIAKDKATVSYIAQGEQDPHFVPPKPSYAVMLSKADMWISTGMDLEMWSATLLDKARNKKIMDGETGFVAASAGVNVLEKIEYGNRTEGDVHLMGNPHINTGPLNLKIIARNITIGLIKSDPSNASFYEKNRDEYINRVDRALFGDKLVDLFGGETLGRMLENGTLFTFLERSYEGGKLIDHLGGWLKKALPFRGKKIITYHKNWSYFAKTFGLEVVEYIEPKPGIPPSAKHVQNVIGIIKDQDIKIMVVASYFEKKTAQMIADKTGIKPVYLPLYVKGMPGLDDNFKLIDYWIDNINSAIK